MYTLYYVLVSPCEVLMQHQIELMSYMQYEGISRLSFQTQIPKYNFLTVYLGINLPNVLVIN